MLDTQDMVILLTVMDMELVIYTDMDTHTAMNMEIFTAKDIAMDSMVTMDISARGLQSCYESCIICQTCDLIMSCASSKEYNTSVVAVVTLNL